MVSTGPARPSGARRASRRVLVFLATRPRWVTPVLAALLLVVGLATSGPASALALLLVAGLLAWLASLSWPLVDPQGRLLRGAAVVALVVLALTRLPG